MAGVIVLASIGFASSAFAGFNPGFPTRSTTTTPAAESHNDKPAGGLVEDPCDIRRLKERIQGLIDQRGVLGPQEVLLVTQYATLSANGGPDAQISEIKGKIDKLRQRLKAIEKRLKDLQAQIASCEDKPGHPGDEPPPPPTEGGHPNGAGDNGVAAGEGGRGGADKRAAMKISCGVPEGDQTQIVLFRNAGTKAIPPGTQVIWSIKAAGVGGTFALPREIAPGKEVRVTNLLKAGVLGGETCVAALKAAP
jgi:hypothetical protein